MNGSEFAAELLDPGLFPQAFAEKAKSGRGRANSSWRGSSAALAELGLRPGMEVHFQDLVTAASGKHILTKAPALTEMDIFDLVLTAPNSVSFAWSQLDAPQRADIEDAVLESGYAVLDHIVRQYPIVDGDRPAESFAAALVLHAIGTRSAAVGVIPPILHVHCCLFGVWHPADGLVPPHEATIFDPVLQREADAYGEAELADRLVQLGWPLRNTGGTGHHSFEIDGVPQALLDDTEFWRNTGCGVAGG